VAVAAWDVASISSRPRMRSLDGRKHSVIGRISWQCVYPKFANRNSGGDVLGSTLWHVLKLRASRPYSRHGESSFSSRRWQRRNPLNEETLSRGLPSVSTRSRGEPVADELE
jgi:hypothetical protein